MNKWTEWTWKKINACERAMIDVATRYHDTSDPLLRRVINQMGRELLLLEASDWQFLISRRRARDYAEARVATHDANFGHLLCMATRRASGVDASTGNLEVLVRLERGDGIFPNLDVSWWVAG